MRNALTIQAIRARHLLSHVFNTGISINIFKVKSTFEMLAVRGQQHSFSTHERMFLWTCQSNWDRKCLDLRGIWTPNLWIRAECSNHLSYQGQNLWIYDKAIWNLCSESSGHVAWLHRRMIIEHWTHWGLLMPYGDWDLGQHWLRWWLVAWRHQVITWTNDDLSSVSSSDIDLWAISQTIP